MPSVLEKNVASPSDSYFHHLFKRKGVKCGGHASSLTNAFRSVLANVLKLFLKRSVTVVIQFVQFTRRFKDTNR